MYSFIQAKTTSVHIEQDDVNPLWPLYINFEGVGLHLHNQRIRSLILSFHVIMCASSLWIYKSSFCECLIRRFNSYMYMHRIVYLLDACMLKNKQFHYFKTVLLIKIYSYIQHVYVYRCEDAFNVLNLFLSNS